jgi:hypothetical protein
LVGAASNRDRSKAHDLFSDLLALNGNVVDKVEGPAIFPNGTAWISTDKYGVDDSSGETYFWSPGQL